MKEKVGNIISKRMRKNIGDMKYVRKKIERCERTWQRS